MSGATAGSAGERKSVERSSASTSTSRHVFGMTSLSTGQTLARIGQTHRASQCMRYMILASRCPWGCSRQSAGSALEQLPPCSSGRSCLGAAADRRGSSVAADRVPGSG